MFVAATLYFTFCVPVVGTSVNLLFIYTIVPSPLDKVSPVIVCSLPLYVYVPNEPLITLSALLIVTSTVVFPIPL